MERRVEYERKITGSYMILEAAGDTLDDRIICKNSMSGVLPIEKCFVNGKGQYWYNITGKQSLDTRGCLRPFKMDEIQKIIIQICMQIEHLEKNLISPDCLILEPEMIFFDNQTREICFLLYPEKDRRLSDQFRELMEYILSKLDHTDQQAVKKIYNLYEITLDDGYSLKQIQEAISGQAADQRTSGGDLYSESGNACMKGQEPDQDQRLYQDKGSIYSGSGGNRMQGMAWGGGQDQNPGKGDGNMPRVSIDMDEDMPEVYRSKLNRRQLKKLEKQQKKERKALEKQARRDEKEAEKLRRKEKKQESFFVRVRRKIRIRIHEQLYGNIYDEKIYGKREQEEDEYYVDVSGEEYAEPEIAPPPNPTVCLSGYTSRPEGILLYEGQEDYTSLRVNKTSTIIGKGSEAEITISRNTISNLHARITKEGQSYYIEDLNSTTGTYVNEEPLIYRKRKELKMNDIVRFADIKYRFV